VGTAGSSDSGCGRTASGDRPVGEIRRAGSPRSRPPEPSQAGFNSCTAMDLERKLEELDGGRRFEEHIAKRGMALTRALESRGGSSPSGSLEFSRNSLSGKGFKPACENLPSPGRGKP